MFCKFVGSEGSVGAGKAAFGAGDDGEEDADEDFVESNMGSSEEAQKWIERLDKLRKNRTKKGGKKEKSEVEEYLVYAGDERGNVVVWDLLPTMEGLIKEYGSTPQGMGMLETPFECGNSRRHIVYDAGEAGGREEGGGPGGAGKAPGGGGGEDGVTGSARTQASCKEEYSLVVDADRR